MDAVKFLIEVGRMCKQYPDCRECPLYLKKCHVGGRKTVEECREMVAIVEKWSKEHPLVTNGDKVMEIIKDAGVPVTARGSGFDREVPVNTVHIAVSEDWWDAEYKEGE